MPAPAGPFAAVIMAGGQGQRFWPLSTAERPKQFLDLDKRGRTLIQATFDRLLPLTGSVDRVFVATAETYVDLVLEQLPELPRENLLVEPTPRDSAPAIALACLTIQERLGDVVVGFFSSDHRIGGDGFASTTSRAIDLAESEAGLVTIGITPTRPATGYGYVELGAEAPGAQGEEQAYHVARFVEKPNLRVAETYVESGRHLWNAGIFVWRVATALEELDRHAPDLMRPLRQAFEAGTTAQTFGSLQRISIDFALLERTSRAYVVPGAFEWDDIGDWVALERLIAPEVGAGGPNTVVGKHVGLDTSRNIVYTEDPDDVIVTLGVHDLIIVKRGKTLLLVHKDRVQEIKSLLADQRLTDLLSDIG